MVLNSCNQNQGEKQSISSVDFQIDSLRIKYNIPAISYGVIRNDTIIVGNAIGYRDIESEDEVQINDLFHIGSNTKAFTSFIAAKIVEKNLISWDTKFFDVFPELIDGSQQVYSEIRLKELLSHRARLIKFQSQSELYPIVDYEKTIDPDLSLAEKRYYFIKQVLKYEPIPDLKHPDARYSNAGYIAAAIMLEKVTGSTWEELINEISEELNLNIQIGWPDDLSPNQPKGHINPKDWMIDIDKELIPLPFALKKYHYFNQYILLCNPSGNLSIRLTDFLEFLRLNIEGLNGKDNYLKSEHYHDLFKAYPDYSNGWMNEDYFVPCFHHKGSAGTFNSIAIIEPDKKIGIVIMMNVANGEAINKIAELLIKKYAT
jgi:CubicO group peptidase (beta-lactamase class C family)